VTRYRRLPPLSKHLMKDPTQSQRHTDRYANRLVPLFKEWGKVMVMSLKGYGVVNAVDLDDFKETADSLRITIVRDPAQTVIEEQAGKALAQGESFGENALNSIGIKIQMGQGPMEDEALKSLLSRNLSGLDNITEATSATIIRSIADGNNLGESIDQIAKRITDAVEDIGIDRARLMAQYETMYAVNTGAMIRYRQAGISYVEWLAADDGHTCDTCRDYASSGDEPGIYKIDEAPICPAHVRCRCALAPVLRVSEDEGTEAAKQFDAPKWYDGGVGDQERLMKKLPEHGVLGTSQPAGLEARAAIASGSDKGTVIVTIQDKEGMITGIASVSRKGETVTIRHIGSSGTTKGTGTRLVEAVKTKYPGKEIIAETGNPGAKMFFQKIGFETVAEKEGSIVSFRLKPGAPKPVPPPVKPVQPSVTRRATPKEIREEVVGGNPALHLRKNAILEEIQRTDLTDTAAIERLKNELRVITEKLNDTKAPLYLNPADTKPTVVIYGKIHPPDATKKKINEGLAFVSQVVNEKNHPQFIMALRTSSGRASAGRATIHLPDSTNVRTVVHELGHTIEDSNPEIRKQARVFLYKRTEGEQAQSLKKLTGVNYDADEVAKKDKFMNPYMGKIYDSGSTEIISMGLEELYANPVTFAKRDPEYFEFIIGVLQG